MKVYFPILNSYARVDEDVDLVSEKKGETIAIEGAATVE